jgi:hypothetical protein
MRPVYYIWSYSPTTGLASIAHNEEGHPARTPTHKDLIQDRPEQDLESGYAIRHPNGLHIISTDNKPIEDPHQRGAIQHKIDSYEIQLPEEDWATDNWANEGGSI